MKKYLLFLCCLCASMLAFAQQQTVTGTVVDEAGLPLIGVSILQKGTTNGVITDMDGNFTLTLSQENGGVKR